MAATPLFRRRGPYGTGGEQLLLAVLAVFVLAFCLLPLGRLLLELTHPHAPALISKVLASRATRSALWHTLEAGIGATLLSLILGLSLALLFALVRLPARTFLVFLVLTPMLVPAQIAALAWLDLTGPSSVLLQAVGLAPDPGTRNWLYSREGIILLMGIEHMPIVFIAVRAALRSVPPDLVEAAQIAGATRPRILLAIILPLIRPAVLAGSGLAFAAAVGNFGIPAILGIPGRYTMLTALIYQRLSGFGPSVLGEVAVLSVMLAVIAGGGLGVQALLHGQKRVALTGSGKQWEPGITGWRSHLATGGILLILVPVSVLPLLALLGTSVTQALGLPLTAETFTLRHYLTVWANDAARRAFLNSAWLSLAAASGTLLLCLPFAWQLVSRKRPLVRFLNLIVDVPYALPGIVVSIAFILAFLRPLPVLEFSLYNTPWIILAAYLARFFALGLRPVVAAIEAQEAALEEAAQIAGSGPLHRLMKIVLPLSAPAAGAGFLLIIMSAYNELTVSALLWSQGNETVGVMVFNLYDEGNASAAAAASVMAVLVTLVAAALASLLARWLPRGVLPWQS